MDLRQQLATKLPNFLMPGNVGSYNKITWPFWQTVTFDFGTNPTYGPNTKQVSQFRVSQDAAFLMSAITWKAWSYDTAGELAALSLRIVDRQSTRQLNDQTLPIQAIGKRSYPTILPTPYLIMPSALIEFELSSWLTANQVTSGIGKHQFIVFGYRVRIEDYETILSAVLK